MTKKKKGAARKSLKKANIKHLSEQLSLVKLELNRLKKDEVRLKRALLPVMDDAIDIETDNFTSKVLKTRRTETVVNYKKLKKKVNDAVYASCFEQTFSSERFLNAVDDGLIPQEVVDSVVEEIQGEPYISVTVRIKD